MKKMLTLVLCLALMIPFLATAEDATVDLAVNREAVAGDYAGTWVLTGAYLAGEGLLEVAPEAMTLEIEAKVEHNVLVDMAAYVHADVTNLQGVLSFDHEDIDVDDYKCTANWDQFGTDHSVGAAKFRIRDDDEGLFFSVLTGADVDDEDMDLMDVIGLNAEGQLILGWSEDHIESDDAAEFEYAYIFTKSEA